MYNTKYCKVEYLPSRKAILCSWKSFCKGNDYRDVFRYATKLIDNFKPTIWITDARNGFKSNEQDSKWLLEEFVPKVIDSSIKKVVFIVDKKSPAYSEILEQKKALSRYFNVEVI